MDLTAFSAPAVQWVYWKPGWMPYLGWATMAYTTHAAEILVHWCQDYTTDYWHHVCPPFYNGRFLHPQPVQNPQHILDYLFYTGLSFSLAHWINGWTAFADSLIVYYTECTVFKKRHISSFVENGTIIIWMKYLTADAPFVWCCKLHVTFGSVGIYGNRKWYWKFSSPAHP